MKPVRYFARRRYVTDYPHSLAPGGGEYVWGLADTLGHFSVCRDEENAKAEAMLRNAELMEREKEEEKWKT